MQHSAWCSTVNRTRQMIQEQSGCHQKGTEHLQLICGGSHEHTPQQITAQHNTTHKALQLMQADHPCACCCICTVWVSCNMQWFPCRVCGGAIRMREGEWGHGAEPSWAYEGLQHPTQNGKSAPHPFLVSHLCCFFVATAVSTSAISSMHLASSLST